MNIMQELTKCTFSLSKITKEINRCLAIKEYDKAAELEEKLVETIKLKEELIRLSKETEVTILLSIEELNHLIDSIYEDYTYDAESSISNIILNKLEKANELN